jgi:HEAT repeat protein
MIRSWRFRLALVLILILAGIWIVPASRWAIIGYLKREHFYEGRPTSYWSNEIQTYVALRSAPGRPVTLWDRTLVFFGIRLRRVKPSILDGMAEGLPVLIDLINSENTEVSREAMIAFIMLAPMREEAIPSLKDAVRTENSSFALRALGNIGPKAYPVLYEALQDERSDVRACAATQLQCLGPAAKSAVPILIELLNDTDDDVRGSAALGLSGAGPDAEAAVPALIELLGDEDEIVRGRAAFALGRIGPAAKPAVPILIEALKDKSDWVYPAAAIALTEIDPKAAETAGASRILSQSAGPAANSP